MNKRPQYNEQTISKQCKSEVEEICIYQNAKHLCLSQYLHISKSIVGSI